MIAHWALDDGSGTTAIDSTGNGFDATLVNGPSWSTSGRIDGALSFDGNNDRLDLPAQAANGLSNLSISLWVQTSQSSGLKAHFSGANAANDNEFSLYWLDGNKLRFHTGESNSSFVDWSASIADGNWHHITILRNAGANQATLYLDGVSLGSKPTTLNVIQIDDNGFVLA